MDFPAKRRTPPAERREPAPPTRPAAPAQIPAESEQGQASHAEYPDPDGEPARLPTWDDRAG